LFIWLTNLPIYFLNSATLAEFNKL